MTFLAKAIGDHDAREESSWSPGGSRSSHPARGALWLILAFLGSVLCVAPAGQEAIPNHVGQRGQRSSFDGRADVDTVLAQRQLNALNEARQKSLVSDTEKLLKLAQELNEEIESANPDSLTSEQMRKIASIEKLAHNVKQKMSLSLAGGPTFHDPIQPMR
jgi:hypothetical protein